MACAQGNITQNQASLSAAGGAASYGSLDWRRLGRVGVGGESGFGLGGLGFWSVMVGKWQLIIHAYFCVSCRCTKENAAIAVEYSLTSSDFPWSLEVPMTCICIYIFLDNMYSQIYIDRCIYIHIYI